MNNPPIALLDACVLYPYTLRDFLMHLALLDLYWPRWSHRIQEEWMINLLKNKKNSYTREQLERTVKFMNAAFELGCIRESSFINIIPTLKLKDKDDRHVLAAAIATGADFIVTFNLKDFPKKEVSSYEISVISPDDFVMELLKNDAKLVANAIQNQSQLMKKWPKSPMEIVSIFSKLGL